MTFRYQSGEEIRKGDRVLFHREPGEIEFVVSEPGDAALDWYLREHGGGVMVLEPKAFGRCFIPTDQIEETEDLEFVSRAEDR
jgi:hypothetical protein